jgi:hypothetical protein
LAIVRARICSSNWLISGMAITTTGAPTPPAVARMSDR